MWPLPCKGESELPVLPEPGPCEGVPVSGSSSLQAAVDSHDSGTTFCLSGRFLLERPGDPRAGDAFIGPAQLEGVSGIDTGFDLMPSAKNVTIDGVEMFGFSDRAIRCWHGAIVRNSNIHDNSRNGIGCSNALNVLIEHNEVHHNGSQLELETEPAG